MGIDGSVPELSPIKVGSEKVRDIEDAAQSVQQPPPESGNLLSKQSRETVCSPCKGWWEAGADRSRVRAEGPRQHLPRCRTNAAHTRQPRPDSSLGFQIKVLKYFKFFFGSEAVTKFGVQVLKVIESELQDGEIAPGKISLAVE